MTDTVWVITRRADVDAAFYVAKVIHGDYLDVAERWIEDQKRASGGDYHLTRENITVPSFHVNELCGEGCGNVATEPHTCPYGEEILGDFKTLCNCCTDCEHNCAMDI